MVIHEISILHIFLSLVSSHILGMENEGSEFKYDLFDNFYEYNHDKKLRVFRNEIEGMYNKLYQRLENKPLNNNMRDFFRQIGLKKDKEYLEQDKYIEMIKKLPHEQVSSITVLNNQLDIIDALRDIFILYYENYNLNMRRRSRDRYIENEPHISIIISYTPEHDITLTGAPRARQDQLFPEDIDYIRLFKHQPTQWFIYPLALVGILNLFVPIVSLRFPSLVDHWGEQINKDFVRENHMSELGLASSSSPTEIKTTCRELFLQWHPDKNRSPDAPERFRRIRESCDILGQE